MTNLLGCIVIHETMSGVIGESWTPTFHAVVRGVESDMGSLLVQVTKVIDKEFRFPVGALMRLPTMAGSKERLLVADPEPAS